MDDDDSSPRLVSLAARHELESLGVSRERFLQLLVFAAACLLTAVNWNILVRTQRAVRLSAALPVPPRPAGASAAACRSVTGCARVRRIDLSAAPP